jgi:hypothetical protein
MLSRIIVSSYAVLLEIAMWIILLVAFIGGWSASGFFVGLGALIGAFVFCVVVFGAFLTLVDIRQAVRAIQEKQKSSIEPNAHSTQNVSASMSNTPYNNSPAPVVDPFACPRGTPIGVWRETMMRKYNIKKGEAADTYVWNNKIYDFFDSVLLDIKNGSTEQP